MTRVLAVALVALAAVALYATTAPAGDQAVTPKQFSALQKRVKTLEADEKQIMATGEVGSDVTALEDVTSVEKLKALVKAGRS